MKFEGEVRWWNNILYFTLGNWCVCQNSQKYTHPHSWRERERDGNRETYIDREIHTQRMLLYGAVRGIYEKFSSSRIAWLLCCLRTLVSNKTIALVFIFSMKLKRLTWHCEKPVFFCFILNKSWWNITVSTAMTFFIQHLDKQLYKNAQSDGVEILSARTESGPQPKNWTLENHSCIFPTAKLVSLAFTFPMVGRGAWGSFSSSYHWEHGWERGKARVHHYACLGIECICMVCMCIVSFLGSK